MQLSPHGYKKEKLNREDSNVATKANFGVALFLSWSESTCNLEMG
jgi:hypothetical protein